MGENIIIVDFKSDPNLLYPVRIKITAIDRYHLLRDIIDCLVEEQHLSMDRLDTITKLQLVSCTIDFSVHSAHELQSVIDRISHIEGVEEVNREIIH